jgi:hypothetical protein
MEEYPHLVGGLRMELRVMIRFNHYIDDVIDWQLQRQNILPNHYSARIYHACKTTVLHRQGHSCWQWYHAPLC